LFSQDLGFCAPNGRIQADGVRERESPVLPGEEREEEGGEELEEVSW
jgi:hypothetical protein